MTGFWRGLLRRGLTAAACTGVALAGGVAAAADCPPQPIRWQDDCAGLAMAAGLSGLDRLRYLPLTADGELWLTLGGEARVRLESLRAADFRIGDGPSYVEVGRRLLAQADLRRAGGGRVFVQMAMTEEDGRRPGPRAQDQDELDIAQLFLDAPVPLTSGRLVARLGRQEINLSDNRLITTRDGVNMRRSFEGVLLEGRQGGVRLTAFELRPVELHRGMFDDGSSEEETFRGLSLDLPRHRSGGANLYLFERRRDLARYADVRGAERRWTAGARWTGRAAGWALHAQGAWQWGEAAGQAVRAYGGWAGAARAWPSRWPVRMAVSAAYGSGDSRSGDGRLETFDPMYPSSNSVGESPLLYPANYMVAALEGAVRAGPAELGMATHVVGRASTADAIWAQGRAMPGSTGGGRATAVLAQASARVPLGWRSDLYVSAVRAFAGAGIKAAGGHDATYLRLQLTSRF